MSYYVSHSPDSFFVQNILCVMPTTQGRIILLNDKLKIIRHENEEVKLINDEKKYVSILKQFFGITLPEKSIAFKKIATIEKVNKNEKLIKTSNWCNYFAKTAIIAGMAGTLYFSNKILSLSTRKGK